MKIFYIPFIFRYEIGQKIVKSLLKASQLVLILLLLVFRPFQPWFSPVTLTSLNWILSCIFSVCPWIFQWFPPSQPPQVIDRFFTHELKNYFHVFFLFFHCTDFSSQKISYKSRFYVDSFTFFPFNRMKKWAPCHTKNFFHSEKLYDLSVLSFSRVLSSVTNATRIKPFCCFLGLWITLNLPEKRKTKICSKVDSLKLKHDWWIFPF